VPIKPNELHRQVTEIIQDVTGCSATWEQHPHALRSAELRVIGQRILDLTDYHTVQAVTTENGSH
jgi:hypothetical protein